MSADFRLVPKHRDNIEIDEAQTCLYLQILTLVLDTISILQIGILSLLFHSFAFVSQGPTKPIQGGREVALGGGGSEAELACIFPIVLDIFSWRRCVYVCVCVCVCMHS